MNGAPREGHFKLWVAEDPAAPRAGLSTASARAGAASPEGAPESVRATVPYVSRHGAQNRAPGSNRRAHVGDAGYLERVFAAFDAGHITESEPRSSASNSDGRK